MEKFMLGRKTPKSRYWPYTSSLRIPVAHRAQVTIIHKCVTLAVNPSYNSAFSELGFIIRNKAK